MKRCAPIVLALLLAAATAHAAEPSASPTPRPVLQGGWAAMAGKRALQGSWTAEIAAETPDASSGAWTMVDAQANIVMQGTWAANKTKKGWRGAWSARVAPSNQIVSGTWEADTSTIKGAKTFSDMLKRGSEVQIAGTWRMGRAHGVWWLRPLAAATT